MKRINSSLRAAAVAVLITIAATAQVGTRITGKVPFPFATSSGAKMTAGEYEITKASASHWMIRNNATGVTTAFQARFAPRPADVAANVKPVLVFRCLGPACSLAEMYLPGDTGGFATSVKAPAATPDAPVLVTERRIVIAD